MTLAILNYALIFLSVYFFGKKRDALSSKLFWIAFLVRLAAGIMVGMVYTYYYPAGDTWSFFYDAKIYSALARQDFVSYLSSLLDFSANPAILPQLVNQDARSIFFIKIISFFCLLGHDNYWVCAAYFSLISFCCAWLLHHQVLKIFPAATLASAVAFLFFPSVVFWSSGLEKETVALCGIYFLSSGLLKAMNFIKPGKLFWLLAIPMAYALWGLKYYWAIIFFDATFTAMVVLFLTTKAPELKKYLVTLWIASFFAVGVALSFLHPNFYLDRFLEVIIANYHEFATLSNPKNLIHYYQFEGTVASLLINSPWALLSGLFRPVVGEGQGLFGIAASVENLLLLILSVSAIINFKKIFHPTDQIILWSAVSYCVVLCIFLALSTPNFGTLSRYRVGFLSFFVFVMVYDNPLLRWILNKIGRT